MPLGRGLFFLGPILLTAVGLRLLGLGWGIPLYTAELAAHNRVRSSFHPDEDKILWQLERMRPSALDLDPKDFGWGSLETYVVGASFGVGDRAGVFGHEGWRAAFRDARQPFFGRVFVLGRLCAAGFGLATVLLAYCVARHCGGPVAGTLAAALVAVSPLHVLHSHYLTSDVALGFWLLTAAWLSLRDQPLGAAFVAGLALATKPSAFAVAPVWLVAPNAPAFLRRAAAFGIGFLIGEPYALLAFCDWFARTREIAVAVSARGPESIPVARLMLEHGWQIAAYGLGPVALILALVGLSRLPVRFASLCAALAISLFFSRFPMSRYVVPLLPLLAVACGVALAKLPRGWLAGASTLALAPPLALSLALVGVLRDDHTATRAARWVLDQAPPGARIAKLWDEIPLLDAERYQLEPLSDPFGLEARAYPQSASDLIVLDDLPIHAWRPELLEDLERRFRLVAVFSNPPRLLGLPLPEPMAAHDWKYTHPVIRIYERRP